MAQINKTAVKRRTTNTSKAGTKEAPPSITGTKPGSVKRLIGVFFGPPKTAKTTLACSSENTLLISFDPDGDATETLRGREDILVVKPRTTEDIDKLVKALHTTDKGRFNTIVVDSLTFLFLMIGGKSITTQWKNDKDVRRAYGKAGAAVQQFVHDLILIDDVNIIFTAHLERENEEDIISLDQELGDVEVKVAVTPMVWRILAPAVSFIGRTYRKTAYEQVIVDGKKKRNKTTGFYVSFNDGERSPAGSRLPMKGEYKIELDTLGKLADELIEGGS